MGIFDGSFLRRGSTKPATKPVAVARPAPKAPAVPPPSQFPASQFPNSQSSIDGSGSPHAMRKDLLRMVLRETLTRTGIPMSWIGADLLRATGRGKDPGVHVRLLVRHWDPRLLVHAVAFEQNFYKRVLVMDPMASNWLMGISWQFAMEDTSKCPALPHPGSWTQVPQDFAATSGGPQTRPGGIIEGPTNLEGPKSADSVRAGLERLLANGDAQRQSKTTDFEATQPIQLN